MDPPNLFFGGMHIMKEPKAREQLAVSEKDKFQLFSTLELVQNDATAQGLERYQTEEVPEVDQAYNAPQRVLDQEPELAFGKSLLIAIENEHVTQSVANGAETNFKTSKSRKGLLFLFIGIVMLLAVGIGTGVSVGLKNRSNAAPSISSVPPTLKHGVLDDSSFAAVTTPDGTRRVFFQDISGSLRQAVYSTSTQSWTAAMNFVIPNTTDARFHTPLSAILLEDTSITGSSPIVLVYVSTNNQLAATLFNYDDSDVWKNATAYFNVSQNTVDPGSRSLSLVQIPSTNGSSELLLWLEDSTGNITGLHGVHASNVLPIFDIGMSTPFWAWQDITAAVRQQLPTPGAPLGAPFGIGLWPYFNESINASASSDFEYLSSSVNFGIGSLFFNPHADQNASIIATAYMNCEWGPGAFISFPSDPTLNGTVATVNTSSILASDWTLITVNDLLHEGKIPSYALFVNGTTLSSLVDEQELFTSPPKTPYPYTRLATTSQTNTSVFYLYHQINETVIAEDAWDISIGAWKSSTISIPTE